MATGNTTLQLAAAPEMRGRVMSLWFVAFQGSTPIGGPLLGWAMGWAGARVGLGAGGVASFVVAAIGLVAIAAMRRRAQEEAPARLDLDSRPCVPSPSANGRSSSPTIPTRSRARERSSSASVPPV
jgi:MFS family permease